MLYSDFHDRHAGATALLFGAGPSLAGWFADRVPPTSATIYAAVNEVPIVAARSLGVDQQLFDYVFIEDPPDHYAEHLAPDLTLFFGETAVRESRIALPPHIAVPAGNHRGSVILAARALQFMGVHRILAIGIDGTRDRAPGLPWISPPSLDGGASYRVIREKLCTFCARAGVFLEFWSPTRQEAAVA